MPKQTIHAEIYNIAQTVSGPGPIYTCRRLTYTIRRDAAGQFRAEFPATDKMLERVSLKNTDLLFRVGGTVVFRGMVERINRVMDRKGKQLLIITGRDAVCGALAENTVGLLDLNYVYDAPSQIVGASNVPNRTLVISGDGYDTTVGSYRKQFAGETGLAALIKVASDLGEHFRPATNGDLEVIWLRTDTATAPVRLVASGGPLLHENPDVAIIEQVESDHNGEMMANRIYPYGAGNGAARLTLEYATNTMPSGYTMSTASNYIQKDDQQGLPSVRRAIHKLFNHIGIENSATYDITVTTTALTGATTIQVESIALPIASGTLLDLNGAGTDFVELSANVSVGANVLNVVATTFDVLDTDTLRYTNPVALEGAARQLATAALNYLKRVADPDVMVSYKLTVRNLPDTVEVGMLIPVLSQAPGFAIDDDLVILEITRSVDRNGQMPAVLTVVPVDWFDLGEAASIAEALAETQNYQAQDQPLDYAVLANAPTVYTQEEIEDFAAAMLTGNTGLIDATYNDGTGAITLTLDVSAADKILYSTAADVWAEAAITAFGRSLIDDADNSAARTTLGLGTIATEAETAYALLAGRSGGQRISGIASTGYALEVYRDLAAASTSAAVFAATQDNSGDDQPAARIQQDGTGAIVEAYDGVTLVLRAADGGRLDVYNIIRALTASGLRLEDDGGNLGISIADGGNVSIPLDLTVTGALTMDGSQDYTLDADSSGRLILQSQSSGSNSSFWLFAKDGDGTDAVEWQMFAVGTPTSLTNRERFIVGYDAANQLWNLNSEAAGSGTVRPFALKTGSNTNQLRLATNGDVGLSTGTIAAKLHVLQGTLGSEVLRLESTATNDDPRESVYQARAATTNATATTLWSMAVPATTTILLQAYVTARRTGGTSGTAEDGGGWVLGAIVKNVAGTATQVTGSPLSTSSAADQAWVAAFDVSGGDVRLRVTGAANNNVTWHATVRIYPVSS